MALRDPASDALLEFGCPRCGEPAHDRFYGPCDRCRSEMRTTMRGRPTDVVAAAYEPKMNVTPNAVAMKE